MDRQLIEIAALSDQGRRRNSNEDNLIALGFSVPQEREQALIAAIDGVGGYAGGAEAALITKEAIETCLKEGLDTGQAIEPLLRTALTKANNAVFEQRRLQTDKSKMSCVISLALLNPKEELLYYGHCGDTRCYIFRKGELIKITRDHSVVGILEDNGDLLEEDALNHPRRNEILKMLGEQVLQPQDTFIDFGTFSLYPGDIVLCCSDGLTDLVNQAGIKMILEGTSSLKRKAQQLIDQANELGGKDNITVVLARLPLRPQTKQTEKEKKISIPIISTVAPTDSPTDNLAIKASEQERFHKTTPTVSASLNKQINLKTILLLLALSLFLGLILAKWF